MRVVERGQVKESFWRTDELHVITCVKLFEVFLKIHQKGVIIQLVQANVTAGTQLAVQRRK